MVQERIPAFGYLISLVTSQNWCFSYYVNFSFYLAILMSSDIHLRSDYPPSLPLPFTFLLSQKERADRAPHRPSIDTLPASQVVRGSILSRQIGLADRSLHGCTKWMLSLSQLKISKKKKKIQKPKCLSFLQIFFKKALLYFSAMWTLLSSLQFPS